MKALDIRERYRAFLVQQGYTPLPEVPLVNPLAEPYFISSAMIPHFSYFDGTRPYHATRLFTQQRCFWTRYADWVGRLPVSTIFQVMMSFYQMEPEDLTEALVLVRRFLCDICGLPAERIFLLIARRDGLLTQALRAGYGAQQIVEWERAVPFSAESVHGYYCRVFVQHRHGILPVADLVRLQDQTGRIKIDSCILLERLSFILQGAETWFETEMFSPLMQHITSGSPHHPVGRFPAILAVLTRSIVAALADGAAIHSKGKGYILRKMLRNLLAQKDRYGYRLTLRQLVAPALVCLANVGYTWPDMTERIEDQLSAEEATYQSSAKKAEQFLARQVLAYQTGQIQQVSARDVDQWWDSRGILPEVARSVLTANGVPLAAPLEETKPERFVLVSGYTFDPTERVSDPREWLIQAEQRLFGPREDLAARSSEKK